MSILFLAASSLANAELARNIRLTTADDLAIYGTYYPVARNGAPAVVLVHRLGKDRAEWASFASQLQQNGIAALTIDLRGHGESTRKITATGATRLDYQQFTERDFKDMLLDVNAAFDWLQEQSGINKRRLAVIGSSMGANIALRYAAFNEELAALGLLSPGLTYRGVRTDDVIQKLGPASLRIFVSRHDAFAFESGKRLEQIRQETGRSSGEKELIVCTGNLHGTEMLTGVRSLPALMLEWLKQVLLGEAPASPAPVADPSK